MNNAIIRTRRHLRGEITYSKAKAKVVNILHRPGYFEQQNQFFLELSKNQAWTKDVVAHQLGLRSPASCHVADMPEWRHGSFNVLVAVTVHDWGKRKKQPGQRVLLRIPLPYRVGDDFSPGNGDENIRCKAGTYAYLQENYPEVPIPQLYGFAVSTGQIMCLSPSTDDVQTDLRFFSSRVISRAVRRTTQA